MQVYDGQVQLATRVPKTIHRRMKLHCVTNDVSVMEFVTAAIEDKLARDREPTRRKGRE